MLRNWFFLPFAAVLLLGLSACGSTVVAPTAPAAAPAAPTVAAPAASPPAAATEAAAPAASAASTAPEIASASTPATAVMATPVEATPVAGKPGAQVVTDPASSFALPGAAVATPAIEGLQTFTITSAVHTNDPVHYPQSPPVGGPHNPVWQTCGFYDQPVPNERGAHSEEHGAVWITYRPDLPQKQVNRLQKLAGTSDYILVSPYPGLDAPVVASAWGAQLKLDDISDKRLDEFIAFYAGHGPEQAPCLGGTDATTPIGTPTGATPMAKPSA